MKLKILLERDEDGWYVATCPALPGCISQGKTEKESTRNMKEAIRLHMSALAEDGIPLQSQTKKKEVFVSVTV